MDLGIVVVLYNGRIYFDEIAAWFIENAYPSWHLVFVDNSADPEIKLSFEILNRSNIHLLSQSRNLGFGAANNIGVNYLDSLRINNVLLLNQDAAIEVRVIHSLYGELNKDEDNVVLSCLNTNRGRDKIDSRFLNYLLASNDGKQIVEDFLLRSTTKRDWIRTDFVNAAIWMLTIETYKKVGGFSKEFFHYGEDMYFAYRLVQLGGYFKVLIGDTAIHYRQIKRSKITNIYNIRATVIYTKLTQGRYKSLFYVLRLTYNKVQAKLSMLELFKLFVLALK